MRIAVAGCGIGGMASAIALARQGHSVEIFERFEQPQPLGAGLLLQPSGLEALDRLGLQEPIAAAGARIDRLHGVSPDGRTILDLRYAYGRKADHGIGIHRASLFDTLLEAAQDSGIRFRTGASVAGISDWERPCLTLETGEHCGPFDLVVVSDGAQSVLRSLVSPAARAPIYPWGAVWAVRPDRDGRWTQARNLAQVYDDCRVMIGVLPVGRDPARADGTPSVSFFWSLRGDGFQRWRDAGLTAFRAQVAGFWPEAAELFDGVESLDTFTPATYRDVRCPNWRRGRVVLIGDAAHGTSPQLGQGANLALGDAVALADSIEPERPAAVSLAAFESERKKTARFYVWMSWALTPVFQGSSQLVARLRNILFGPLCRVPLVRNFMAWTLVGRGRWFW
ncbi:FAD-dependent oxidoreductase [Hyphobacterium marinum]|uniref:NAD(P)/FAD-dependent oxidoreductase n=1 Tax=Hyphobacterium marinum TaxID=3116574 RepID=A0ABU7LWJ2_9PROT|nr:NAD(P)/FAD-dependent oxidoreductase [Hyphobacterium sp. Y6023]MEE2565926.1 NAD(P)/FAD-dependent oxidoreductase [Hyphobacterium sp. Y6023]